MQNTSQIVQKSQKTKTGMRSHNVDIHFEKGNKHSTLFEQKSTQRTYVLKHHTNHSIGTVALFHSAIQEGKTWVIQTACASSMNSAVSRWYASYICGRSNSGKMRVYPHLCKANPEFFNMLLTPTVLLLPRKTDTMTI